MTDEIKIHKGIPVPLRHNTPTSKYRLHELKVGEAIHITRTERASVIAGWKRFAPKKFTSEVDNKDPNMCHVWRIK